MFVSVSAYRPNHVTPTFTGTQNHVCANVTPAKQIAVKVFILILILAAAFVAPVTVALMKFGTIRYANVCVVQKSALTISSGMI